MTVAYLDEGLLEEFIKSSVFGITLEISKMDFGFLVA
jgi:hypothetical protein